MYPSPVVVKERMTDMEMQRYTASLFNSPVESAASASSKNNLSNPTKRRENTSDNKKDQRRRNDERKSRALKIRSSKKKKVVELGMAPREKKWRRVGRGPAPMNIPKTFNLLYRMEKATEPGKAPHR